MITIKGVLKQDITKEFKRKDGSKGEVRILFIEPQGSIYPIRVNTQKVDLKLPEIGKSIEMDVNYYPYYFEGSKRHKANIDFYF